MPRGQIRRGLRPEFSKDQKAVKALSIPYSVEKITNCSMEEFGNMLEKLSKEQINLCRDIRRRGKNKVAAQNCRKRRQEQATELEEEIEKIRGRKEKLLKERE